MPANSLHVDPKLVLKNEPIRRGAGKPHMVAEVFRSGGERILICNRHPNGVSETEYKKSPPHPVPNAGAGNAASAMPRFMHGVPCVTAITPRLRCTIGTKSS